MKQELQPRDVYKIGDIIEFKVKKPYSNYCELIDEQSGITTYLQGTEKLILFKDLTVKCRITAVNEKHPRVALVDVRNFEQTNAGLTEKNLFGLLSERGIQWNVKDFIKLLLTEEKEISFNSQCHRWIQSLLNRKVVLETVYDDCSNLLEMSKLLDLCSETEREIYQNRLTLTIEQLGYYIKAAELIDNEANPNSVDTATSFIDSMFKKLTVSGFIYHPVKNFNILSCLFLRRPDIMNDRMKQLLEILRRRNVSVWKKEPFRSAIIKLLELYVRELDGKIYRTKDNKERLTDVVQALSLQLMLMCDDTENGTVDYRLSASRLCLVSSYLNLTNSQKLVDLAFETLFQSQIKKQNYSQDYEKNVLVPYILSALPLSDNIDTINSFAHSKAVIRISSEGIHILSNKSGKTLHAVFPKDLGLWKGLQIFMDEKTTTSLTSIRSNDITPYRKIWEEIEFMLFKLGPMRTFSNGKSKNQHVVNETVNITFVSQDENVKDKYYCQIEDEIGGQGFIYVKDDIVPYVVSTSIRHFLASDGSRYIFKATIIGKSEGGQFHFSMAEDMKKWINNEFCADNEGIVCSLGTKPSNSGMVPAISVEGISVIIKNADKFEGLDRYSTVSCHRVGEGNGTFHIMCEIDEVTKRYYDLVSAFSTLMKNYAIGSVSEKDSVQGEDDERMMESDKVLDVSYVREVIYLIDRMALIEGDYVKSYNYLGFARILCLLVAWESQAALYKGRMDIISMLHFFAVNSRVDEEKLNELAEVNSELFSNNTALYERFKQLQTVSFLGKPEYNDELYRNSKEIPSLKVLASLVLAYNITKNYKLESVSNEIHNRIKLQLNLKGFESGLKTYGTGWETVDTEYKTSIVFSAEESSGIPNQYKQMQEILKVIDSFLNTSGGTLYVGVNDSGLGVGVENDLNTSLYYNDKDKYQRTIIDAVVSKWGNSVATTYIDSIGFDAENKEKNILIVKINPHDQGLALDGEWWVRVGGTKRRLTNSEYTEFKRNKRRLEPMPVANEVAVPQEPIALPTMTNNDVTTKLPLVKSKEDDIRTSRIRKNVLAEYLDPDNFVEPIAFLKFLGNGKFKKLDEYDYDEETTLLTLTVLEDELKESLVLGYENGHIVRVPIKELLGTTNREYARNTDSKLIFASIAKLDDAVLTISLENKTRPKALMRLDTVSKLEEDHITGGGNLPCNEGLMGKVLAFDVIPSEHKDLFSSVLDNTKSFLGYPASPYTQTMIDQIHAWGIEEI